MQVNIHEAKTHFSKILMRVIAGQEVIIAKAGVPIARIVPLTKSAPRRFPGSAKGKLLVAPDFNESLPENLLQEFEK